MVQDCHELGESWSPKYGMVGSLERRNLEDDGLRAVVVPSAEGDQEGDLADRSRAGTRDDAVEGLVRGDQLHHVEAHVLQGLGKDDVEGTASINEHPGQTDLVDHRVYHEGISTRPGLMYLVVASVKGGRDLRPEEGLNRVPEHRVDIAVVQLGAALAGRRAGNSEDDVHHPLFLLKVAG